MKQSLIALIVTMNLLTGCKPDACKHVECINGICYNGDCFCNAGFDGVSCETEQRLSYLATYNVDEFCNPGTFTYQISISPATGSVTEVIINNIGNFNFNIVAMVNGNTLTIDHTTNSGAQILGSGSLTSGVLTINYSITTTSGQNLNCEMTCTPL